MDIIPGATAVVVVNIFGATGPVTPDGDSVGGVLSGYPDAVPTVTKISDGQYQLTFSDLCPALADGDELQCLVSGTIADVAWTPFAISLNVVADNSLAGIAASPRVVQAGTERIEEHSLSDQIAFDRYKKQQQSQSAKPGAVPVLRWQQTHGRP